VLYDAGLVSCREPFQKLYHQGMILGEDGEKMSKSRGNVINPDHIIEQYGADTLRVYEMFMGPLERDKPWSTSAIEGVYRFLQRTWRLFVDDEGQTARVSTTAVGSQETLKQLHKTIQKVTDDIENCHFNTAVSQMMIFVNYMTQLAERPISCLLPFVQLLQPFAPHLAEELWERLGQTSLLTLESWPSFDPNLARDHVLTIAVQIMGKTRATLEVPVDVEQEVVVRLANQNLTIANHLKGKEIKKVIFVKNKILNFVHA
jgi:leucyl-tRNA synthetase